MAGVPADATLGKPGKITEFEGNLFYDKTKLELLSSIEGKEDEKIEDYTNYEILPNIHHHQLPPDCKDYSELYLKNLLALRAEIL